MLRMSNLLRSLLISVTVLAACQREEKPKTEPPREPVAARKAPTKPEPTKGPVAHADHDPRHGGTVLMDGDVHFEAVISRSGEHRVYFTDAVRNELPASCATSVAVTIDRGVGEPERVELAPDPSGKSWTGKGRPIDEPKAVARVEYMTKDKTKPYWIDLAVGGEASKPTHGGQVAPISDGKLELVAGSDGKFQLWILGETGKPRDIAGAAARVKVSLSGYADVELKPAGDHLAGAGAPIPAEHATAIVVLTRGDKSETARFGLHLETGTNKHGGH